MQYLRCGTEGGKNPAGVLKEQFTKAAHELGLNNREGVQ